MEAGKKTGKKTGTKFRTQEIVKGKLIENYEKYYRLAYSYVHNESDAQDIVQEGACKAIVNSGSLKQAEYADTWIYRIMVNEAFNLLRKNRREQPGMDGIEEPVTDIYGDTDLYKALDTLEPFERTVVVLRFFEDLKLEQIAGITGENINTVKSRLYRALKKLNLTLREEAI